MSLVTGQCTPGESRLVDGTSLRDGVIEICRMNSTWGTACEVDFECEDAAVACRQLGFQSFCKYDECKEVLKYAIVQSVLSDVLNVRSV